MKKDDVDFHRIGYGNRTLPAINVKVYAYQSFRDAERQVTEKFGCDEKDAEKAVELAFDSHQRQFWDDVQEVADDAFGKGTKVYSEGRSGGWLVVDGLPKVEEWDAIQLGKWSRFEKAIHSSIEYLTSAAELTSTIEANEYYKHGSEEYNFIERKDGSSACIADLKREAIKAGFGPVVRL